MSLLSVTVKRANYVGPQASQLNTYIALQLQNVKSTTVTVKGANPAWEQDFLFETNRLDTGLLVEVWNKGLIWDKILGYHWLPLQHVPYSNEEGAGQWLSIDAEQEIQDGYVVGTKIPTGHSLLLDCRLELPYDADDTEYSELQRKLEAFNHIMDQELGSLLDPSRRQQFIIYSGLSEDSDYTSDVSYPLGCHQANSSASQYLSVAHQLATPQRSLETSRENSYDNGEPNGEESLPARDHNNVHYGQEPDSHEPLSYNSRPKNHKETRYHPYSNYSFDKDSPDNKYGPYDPNAWYTTRADPNFYYSKNTQRTARRPSLERQSTLYDEQQYSGYPEQYQDRSFDEQTGYREEDSFQSTQGRYPRTRHKLPAIPTTHQNDTSCTSYRSTNGGTADGDMGYDPGGGVFTDSQSYDEYYQYDGYAVEQYPESAETQTDCDYQNYYNNDDYNYDYNYAYQSNENLTNKYSYSAVGSESKSNEIVQSYEEKAIDDNTYETQNEYYAEERWAAEGEAASYEYSDENGYYYEGQWYTWDGAYYGDYEYADNGEYFNDPNYENVCTNETVEDDSYLKVKTDVLLDNNSVLPNVAPSTSSVTAKSTITTTTTASVAASLVKPGLSFFSRAKEKVAELERKLAKDKASAGVAAIIEQPKAPQELKRLEPEKKESEPLRQTPEQLKRRESYGKNESVDSILPNNSSSHSSQREGSERYRAARDDEQIHPTSFDRTLSRESADLTSDESMHRRSSGETPHFEITDSGEWDDYKMSIDLDHEQPSPLEEQEDEEMSRRGSKLSQRAMPADNLGFAMTDRRASIQSNLSASRRERFEDFRSRRSSSICDDYNVDNSVIEPYQPYQHDEEDEEEMQHMDRLRRTPSLDEDREVNTAKRGELGEKSGKSVSFEDDEKFSKESSANEALEIEAKPKMTAKQRWHWAYNKVCSQINVSRRLYFATFLFSSR